jgi:hypothetical protein
VHHAFNFVIPKVAQKVLKWNIIRL